MIKNEIIKAESKVWLNRIIKEQKIKIRFYITIKYNEEKSKTIEDTEKLLKHFKNLLLCKIHRVTNKKRLPDETLKMIVFHEMGEAETHFHSHILIEAIPNYQTLESVQLLLKVIQKAHKGIDNGKSGIDVRFHHDYQKSYSLKQTTNRYIPLDIINSDII
jgi:hypothetical protein